MNLVKEIELLMYSKTKYFLITFTFFIFASCKHTCLYDIHKITTPPTCTQEGVQTFECSICNDSFSSILPKIDHLYQTTDIIEATCEIDGSETKTCQYCNNSYTTTILAVGHSYYTKERTEPTCIAEGSETKICENCSDIKLSIISKTEHDKKSVICSSCKSHYNVDFSELNTLYKVDELDVSATFIGIENDNGYKVCSIMWTVANNVENSLKNPGVAKLFYIQNNKLQLETFTGVINSLYYNDSKIFAYQWKLQSDVEFVCIQYLPNCDIQEYYFSEEISPNSIYFKLGN